nr:hypothetical protein CFP56_70403 [Quercus suber]
MARPKQALFPARFANPLRRTTNAPLNTSDLQPNNATASHNAAPEAQQHSNSAISSPLTGHNSPATSPSVLAPRSTRISKHARKYAPSLSSPYYADSDKQESRRTSNGSTYAPSEEGGEEDEDSLFLPMDEPRPGSPELLGGSKDAAKNVALDHTKPIMGASIANVHTDAALSVQHGSANSLETNKAFSSSTHMTTGPTPVPSISPRQTTVSVRASSGSSSTTVNTARLSTNAIKSDPARRNPHSLPDLSAKLTSVITVSTRGPRNCESKIVTLHVAMLEDKSPFLTRLAESSPDPDLYLLELDCDAFSKFAAWVYGGGFEFDTFLSEDLGDILNSVLDCYTLALKLEATLFANAVLEKACKVSAERGLVFRDDVVNAIFARTNRGSKLRKWIVDEWVWQFDAEGVSEISWASDRVLDKEIMFEMFQTAAKRLGKGRQLGYCDLEAAIPCYIGSYLKTANGHFVDLKMMLSNLVSQLLFEPFAEAIISSVG